MLVLSWLHSSDGQPWTVQCIYEPFLDAFLYVIASICKYKHHIFTSSLKFTYMWLKITYIFLPPAHISVHMFAPSVNVIMWTAYLQVWTYFWKHGITALTYKSVKMLLYLYLFSGSVVSNTFTCCNYLPCYLLCSLFVLFLSTSSLSCCCNDPVSLWGSLKFHQI